MDDDEAVKTVVYNKLMALFTTIDEAIDDVYEDFKIDIREFVKERMIVENELLGYQVDKPSLIKASILNFGEQKGNSLEVINIDNFRNIVKGIFLTFCQQDINIDTDSEFQCEPCDREWLFRIINIYSNMIKTIKRLHIIHSWYNIGNIYDIIHETAVVKDNNKYSFFEADIKGGYNRMIKMFSEIDRPLRIKAQGDFFNIIKHGVLATENHVQLLVLSTFAQLQRYLRQNMKFTKEWYINVENVNNIVTTHECMIELPFFPRTIKRPLIDLFEALKQTDDNIEISVRKYINPMLETYKEVTIGNVKKYEGNKYMFNDGRVMSSTALAYFVNAVGYHVENDKDINFPELAETCVANARMLKFAHTQFGSDKVKSLLIAGRSLHDLLKSDFTAFELLENLLGQEHADSFLKRGRIVVNSVNGSKYVIKNDAKVYILDENGKEGSYRCVEILKGGIPTLDIIIAKYFAIKFKPDKIYTLKSDFVNE